jgi:hypothetical protein
VVNELALPNQGIIGTGVCVSGCVGEEKGGMNMPFGRRRVRVIEGVCE